MNDVELARYVFQTCCQNELHNDQERASSVRALSICMTLLLKHADAEMMLALVVRDLSESVVMQRAAKMSVEYAVRPEQV